MRFQNDPRQTRPFHIAYIANNQHPNRHALSTRSDGIASILLGGLILLQVITLAAALLVARSDHRMVNPIQDTKYYTQEQNSAYPRFESSYELSFSPIVKTPAGLPNLPALKLRGLEITQGIQVFNEPELPSCNPNLEHPHHIFCNNSAPLVAGRFTLARVYLACIDACPTTDIIARLRLFKDGQEKVGLTRSFPAATLQEINQSTMPQLRLSLDKSINFEFFPPPDWLVGQITFVVEVLPQSEIVRSPATLTLTEEFVARKSLRVAYLPIIYQGLRPPEPANIDYWLLRMYPTPDVQYYRLPVPDLIWEGELNKDEVLRVLYTYWLYAQNQPPETRPDQLFGWLPQEVYNGGVADPYWCSNCAGIRSGRVAFGGLRPEPDIGGPRILAHEIAHNMGVLHAWSPTKREDEACFRTEETDIWVDPAWPYSQTPHIQEYGIDLYSNPPIVYPPSSYDVMAYCNQPWISPYTYRKIFNSPFLQLDSNLAQPLASAQLPNGGKIYSDILVDQGRAIEVK